MSDHNTIPSPSEQHDAQADSIPAVDEYSPSSPEFDFNGTFEDFVHWDPVCYSLSCLISVVWNTSAGRSKGGDSVNPPTRTPQFLALSSATTSPPDRKVLPPVLGTSSVFPPGSLTGSAPKSNKEATSLLFHNLSLTSIQSPPRLRRLQHFQYILLGWSQWIKLSRRFCRQPSFRSRHSVSTRPSSVPGMIFQPVHFLSRSYSFRFPHRLRMNLFPLLRLPHLSLPSSTPP
jgi:hypothetical protein